MASALPTETLEESEEETTPIKKGQSRLLKTEDHENLLTFLERRTDSLIPKIVAYKKLSKEKGTTTFDGQIRYWENQISTFKWLHNLIIQANR